MDQPLHKSSIREVNERAILAAAESVFAERGYSGATMSMIAAKGPEVFYQGEVAAGIVRFLNQNGGLFDLEDLATYTAISTESPLQAPYGKYTVVGTRNGFRDVRREITVAPGQDSQTIRVTCSEPI